MDDFEKWLEDNAEYPDKLCGTRLAVRMDDALYEYRRLHPSCKMMAHFCIDGIPFYECSNCNEVFNVTYNYCAYCGARVTP